MAYNSYLFEKYKTVSKLPLNRRKVRRRIQFRRQQLNLLGTDRRLSIDRRSKDRREVCLEITLNSPIDKVTSSLISLDLICIAFPNITINSKRTISRNRYTVDWISSHKFGSTFTQTEIYIDPNRKFISFSQLRGDFQYLDGKIELSPIENGTKVKTSFIIGVGLPSFEAFMGNVFKSKIRNVVKKSLQRIQEKFGSINKNFCDFGFLVHTIPDYFTTTFSDNSYATTPEPITKYLLSELPPFKCCHVTGVSSKLGHSIQGNLIYSPYSPFHFLNMDKNQLLNHMIEASLIAKDLGAKIIGLGAYTAFIGKRGIDIASSIKMPVTTGTAYTIATAIRALKQAALQSQLPLKDATVMIIGATGSIGKACAEIICPDVNKIILAARNMNRLQDLKRTLKDKYPNTEIEFTNDIDAGIKKSNLILISTNTPEVIIRLEKVIPGTIICDISQPRNISYEDSLTRQDVLVIDGGVVEPPGNPNFNFYFGLPPGLAFACIAETMILALEKRYESYSIGGNITAQKVLEIDKLGEKHGFKLAELKSFGNFVPEDYYRRIQNERKKVLITQ